MGWLLGGSGLYGRSHKAQLQLSLPLSPKACARTAQGQDGSQGRCHQPAASGKDSPHSTSYWEEGKKHG